MGRRIARVVVATALIGLGWSIGWAQRPEPDFELIVNAPAGETTIECVRGCELMWVERGLNPNDTPTPKFTFACGGGARCSSARVGDWAKH